ncbi:hypothetical protein JCM8208_006850 [Rhodotorula glutinis]
MANAHPAPPGQSPLAERLSQLEMLLPALSAAAARDGSGSQIQAAALAASIVLPGPITNKAKDLAGRDLSTDVALNAARQAMSDLAIFTEGALSQLQTLPPTPQPSQDGVADVTMQREISRMYVTATQLQLHKGTKLGDVVRKVANLFEYMPKWMKDYPPDAQVKAITPYKLLMAAASASSNESIARWWRDEGQTTDWAEHKRRADIQLTAHVKETEEEVYARFSQLASSFDWLKEHKNEDDMPVLPSVMYASRLSSILADAPSQVSGQAGAGWLYSAEALKHLPPHLDAGTTSSMKDAPLDVLAAIKRIPRLAYERAERLLEQQDRRMRAIHALKNEDRRGLTAAQAHPIVFADSAAGRDSYKKAVATFMQTQGATPSLTAKFPLTPGTATVPSSSCDKCGHAGHISYNCSSPNPVPMAERNYRRHWRLVDTQGRLRNRDRAPPNRLTSPEKQVNMIGEINQLMAYEEDLFYPLQDDIDAALDEAGKA